MCQVSNAFLNCIKFLSSDRCMNGISQSVYLLRYGLDGRRILAVFPTRARNFSLIQPICTCHVAHTSSPSVGIWKYFSGVKLTEVLNRPLTTHLVLKLIRRVPTYTSSAAWNFLAWTGTNLHFRARIKFNFISLSLANRRFWQIETEDVTGCLLGVNTLFTGWWKTNMEWRIKRENWKKIVRRGTRCNVTWSVRTLTLSIKTEPEATR